MGNLLAEARAMAKILLLQRIKKDHRNPRRDFHKYFSLLLQLGAFPEIGRRMKRKDFTSAKEG